MVDKTYVDVRVIYPGVESNKAATIEAAIEKHEQEKKRTYNKKFFEVEKATLSPQVLIFSTTGGMKKEE